VELQPYLGQLFTILHYLHEELLLSKFHLHHAKSLAKLLCKWILSLPKREGLAKAAFLWYYMDLHHLREHDGEVREAFGAQMQDLRSSQSMVSIVQAPVLRETLAMLADNKQTSSPFLVFFERTRKILRAAQMMALSKFGGVAADNLAFAQLAELDFSGTPAILSCRNLYVPSAELLQQEAMYEDANSEVLDLSSGGQSPQQYYLQTVQFQPVSSVKKLLLVLFEESLEDLLAAGSSVGLSFPAWASNAVAQDLGPSEAKDAEKMLHYKHAFRNGKFDSTEYVNAERNGFAAVAARHPDERMHVNSAYERGHPIDASEG